MLYITWWRHLPISTSFLFLAFFFFVQHNLRTVIYLLADRPRKNDRKMPMLLLRIASGWHSGKSQCTVQTCFDAASSTRALRMVLSNATPEANLVQMGCIWPMSPAYKGRKTGFVNFD